MGTQEGYGMRRIAGARPAPPRIITIREGDQLQLGRYVVDTAVLKAIVDPCPRVLWRFTDKAGRVIATPYTERDCIWIDRPGEEGAVDGK